MIKKLQEYLTKTKDVASENGALPPTDAAPLKLSGSFQRVAFFTFFGLAALGALAPSLAYSGIFSVIPVQLHLAVD